MVMLVPESSTRNVENHDAPESYDGCRHHCVGDDNVGSPTDKVYLHV